MSHNKPKVKICGLRDTESALVAADAGADYLGFNFVEGVRRQLVPMEGQHIVRSYRIRDHRRGSPGPRLVGLFRNQDAHWVNTTTRNVDLDYVQLTGDEDETYIRSMWKPVIKHARVKEGMTPDDVDELVAPHLDAGRIVLLDRYDRWTPGGAGKAFDWSAAAGVANRDNVMLAGGLNPDNVRDAIAQLDPWGVDVASGVETDGVKDHAKIRAFVQAAKSSTSVTSG